MNKQLEILRLIKQKQVMTFQEICNEIPFGYYHNTKHYVGQILSTMIKKGTIRRVKRGVYKYIRDKPLKRYEVPKNQLPLF